jgi:hypothetical protein
MSNDMKSGFGLAAALASVVCLLSGCDGVSGPDKRFIAATMPPSFEAFRMYDGGGASAGRQACLATIRTPYGDAQESVVLERGSGITFDVSAARDGSSWEIRSDGSAPTEGNAAIFHALLVDCVSALQDKYFAEPPGAVRGSSPLHR